MTSIRRFDRSLANLRKTLGEKSKAQGATAKSGLNGLSTLSKRERGERAERLEERLRGRLSGLNIAHAEQQERAVSLFLETVLAHEFGNHLLHDPQFQQMLSDVRQGMLNHEATRDDLLKLLSEFTGSN